MDRIQRPTPLRPNANATRTLNDQETEYAGSSSTRRMRSSRSMADLGSLSRSASFLSFSGLAETSSALFGIFERGGYASPDDPAAAATAPSTPDISPRLPDGRFAMAKEQRPHHTRKSPRQRQQAIKCACIFVASFLFITLFNKLPKNNTFCKAITSQDVPRLPYAFAATLVSLLVPFLDTTLSATQPPSTTPKKDRRPLHFSLLVRYFAGFLGVAYAGTKLDYNDAATFNTCCALITLGYVFWVDGTIQGFAILMTLTALGTAVWAAAVAWMAARGADVQAYESSAELVSACVLIGLNVSVWGTMGKLWQRGG